MELFVDIEKHLADFALKVNFNINQGTLGLLGASGSGKTMTLRCIAGLETPDKGRIILNGRTLFDSSKHINLPSYQRKIGFVFQNYALFPHMTVSKNIAFGLCQHSKSKQQQKISQYIDTFRLTGKEHHYPYELSGGQQQRVALARALATEPEALLLDEPFSALDVHLRDQVEDELLELLSTYKGITLFVSHNLQEAYRMCQHIAILDKGQLIDIGLKTDMFLKPSTRAGATITGCKNITPCYLLGTNQVQALDWGCTLTTDEQTTNTIKSIGIRANHLQFSTKKDIHNTFSYKIQKTTETPDKITLFLAISQQQTTLLQLEVDRDYWQMTANNPPPYIHLPPEKILLLS